MRTVKPDCKDNPPHLHSEIARVEAALGDALGKCVVCYDEGDDHPWRIADASASASYNSVEEALAAAPEWVERNRN